jgi:hypothetical protein
MKDQEIRILQKALDLVEDLAEKKRLEGADRRLVTDEVSDR